MSATVREIRRLAFLGVFQLDARGEDALEEIRGALEESSAETKSGATARDIEKALSLAKDAFAHRRGADAEVLELAPGWPAQRQPAVDRAVLRLAIYEMRSGRTPPKVAVNEALELTKRYSTERSPAFVNGVLDKVLKKVLSEQGAADAAVEHVEEEGA